ncbi:hypothetical protein [Photobacterium sp. TY1-4]|uniref:hypothetical protein n=1 Tax=Photobacterium sp. TY1-4 TaxID=2899122 RepID=UPI0021C0E278|nr:hypothetical protein [Photobacterium sp. TY1-4]UXI00455.1 hypothetical protein NH461_11605 [Photobacterium sp. TY1-4]
MANTAEKLQQARQQHARKTPHLVPVISTPKSRADVDAVNANVQVKTGADHLADAKALFKAKHARSQVKLAYESLSQKQRGMVCIAAGLSPHDFSRHFNDFNDQELQQLRKGLLELTAITRRFENSVGNLQHLKPHIFH